jgi:putative phosphoribosyl transferase
VIGEGAGHLFEEPGTLDEVVRHAKKWLADHLNASAERTLNGV